MIIQLIFLDIFQSTLPCGSDIMDLEINFYTKISIHAPLRERQTARYIIFEAWIFQSTLPCGSDRNETKFLSSVSYFNPRSLAGATRSCKKTLVKIVFQSTLPCGSDVHNLLHSGRLPGFQSTLPCGSDTVPAKPVELPPNFNPRSLAGATLT